MPEQTTPPTGGNQDQAPARAKTLGGYHYIDEDGQRRWHALPCIVIKPDLEWIEMMAKREARS